MINFNINNINIKINNFLKGNNIFSNLINLPLISRMFLDTNDVKNTKYLSQLNINFNKNTEKSLIYVPISKNLY